MPLEFLYQDKETKEEQRFLIKVLLDVDYPTSNTVSQHPSENKTSFIDNSIENIKELTCTVFIPHREEIEKSNSELTKSSNFITNINNFGLSQNKNLLNTTFSEHMAALNTQDNIQKINNLVKYRYKNEVYSFLQKLKKDATILTLFTGNEFFDGDRYIIKEISHNESIETGNALELKISFIEAIFVSKKTIQLTKEQVEKLKALLKASQEVNNSSAYDSVSGAITNKNRTSENINKGTEKISNKEIIESIRKKNPYASDMLIPVKGGKYVVNQTRITDSKRQESFNALMEECVNAGAKGFIFKP